MEEHDELIKSELLNQQITRFMPNEADMTEKLRIAAAELR
jgi:hypothetical protein